MAYGPAPKEHQVVYTTLHFDTPWSIDSYRQMLEQRLDRRGAPGAMHAFNLERHVLHGGFRCSSLTPILNLGLRSKVK